MHFHNQIQNNYIHHVHELIVLLHDGVMLCECGEFIKGNVFRDYIRTSANPSTSTIGHWSQLTENCKVHLLVHLNE